MSDAADAAGTDDTAADGVGSMVAVTHTPTLREHTDARGGGKRASREVAGLRTDLSEAATAATPMRRGGSRTTAQDRHGDGPASAAAAAAAERRAKEDAATRRRAAQDSRVRIAAVEAGTAALKRGIAIGARMAEMMGQGGDGGRAARGRRVRRGEG